jgi:hypothetical protein
MEDLRKKGLRLEDLTSSELQTTGGGDPGSDFWGLVDKGRKFLYMLTEYLPSLIEGFKNGFYDPTLYNAE